MTDLQDRLERSLSARADGIALDTRLLHLIVRDGVRRRRRRRLAGASALGAVAVAAAVLGAVNLAAPGAPVPDDGPAADRDPVIAALEPADMMPSAIVRGILVLKAGCLLLEPPDATDRSAVLMWPAGTTWDQASRTVVVDDRNSYRVGERMDGGGGYFEAAFDVTWILGEDQADEVAECARSAGADSLALFYPADAG